MKVSEAELTQLYKQEPNAKKKEKLLAMLHILVKGKTITEVAEFLCKAYNTIKAWRARFLKHGPDGLDDKPRPGRPRKIKNQTLDKFIKKADLVFPSLVAEAVTAETGVECNAAKVRRRLHENDYTRKTPVPAYYRRDSVEDVLEWQKKIGYWTSCLERDGFCLYAMDQATIMLDYQNKAGPWSPEGQRVYMGYYGQHRKIMVCAGVSPDGPTVWQVTNQFRAADAVEYLKLLMRRRKVGLIMDKAPVHRSRAVQDLIEDNKHRLRVQYFPTGWPELNIMENGWSVLKSRPFIYKRYDTLDERIAEVKNFMGSYRFSRDVAGAALAEPIAKTF